ncbi:MAG TPA: HDOD domain-containing protein [Thiohalobacter sp.]|nr:HDOD domain-containing protein [Thiohalobacter sp.]
MESPPSDPHHSRLQEILHLPPLPAVAYQLLKEMAGEDVDFKRLTELIEQDPGLAARIVGIANSAYFARQREIYRVEDAITRVLGLNLVRGLAIGIALSKPFDVSACPAFELNRYWYRAFVSAQLSNAVGPHLELETDLRECLFLAGLVHNLGQLVLVHAFPSRMADVFRRKQADPGQSLLALESQVLAMTEMQAGTVIGKRWKLPRCVTHTIQYRQEPNLAGRYEPAVHTVAVCSRAAESLYDDLDHTRLQPGDFGGLSNTLTQGILDDIIGKVRQNDAQYRALADSLGTQE